MLITQLNSYEDGLLKSQFPNCNDNYLREDIIFAYSPDFTGDPKEIAVKLQSAYEFLKFVTGINTKDTFPSRIIIGFTDQSPDANWSGKYGNRIHIPEKKYINKLNEPLDVCSHELVHPFFRCSPLHNKNEGWGDGFCEFLRGPVKNIMGLDGDAFWQQIIEDAINKIDGEYHYPGGQFAIKAHEHYGKFDEPINEFINNNNAIRDFIEYLFSNFKNSSISTIIEPSPKMIKNWRHKGKI